MDITAQILALIILLVAVISAWHALLYKRHSRSAFGWVAIILLFPLAGSVLYFLFGINRTKNRAKKMRSQLKSKTSNIKHSQHSEANIHITPDFNPLINLSDSVSEHPLITNNSIDILHNGEACYPAMLNSINSAQKFIYLSSYIFDNDNTGQSFINALGDAVQRGVNVKVLLDGYGEWRLFHKASSLLRKQKINVARFIPPRLLPPTLFINLRNHRKILICDGKTAYVGGMNISDRHLVSNTNNADCVSDIQFCLSGSIIKQVEKIFLDDWLFTTGETIPLSQTKQSTQENFACRAIIDGPDNDIDSLTEILIGAITIAKKNVSIMTPYFLPNRELIGALKTAALKGIEVNIILPGKSDLAYVKWATQKMLWELLQRNINIYYQPAPFTHTKLFIVDHYYSHIGSANLDPRSLRLNFELIVEIYSTEFAKKLMQHFNDVKKKSHKITLSEVENRSLMIKTRDALAWLFSPYL